MHQDLVDTLDECAMPYDKIKRGIVSLMKLKIQVYYINLVCSKITFKLDVRWILQMLTYAENRLT